MQGARLGSSSSGGPGSADALDDGMADGSFHSPEWHAARLASLSKSHTITWEEFKKQQKEDELKRGEMEADKDRMMRVYPAHLDAERAKKLAHDRKFKDENKRRKKRRKLEVHQNQVPAHHRNLQAAMTRRGMSRNLDLGPDQRRKRSTGDRSRSKHVDSDGEEEVGPVGFSKFFGNVKC